MKDQGLLQSSDLYQYILETSVYPRESEVLKELRDITSTHPRQYMRTATDEGPLITILLKLVNAKKTIEIGVYTGYSLLLTALALPEDGKIVGIDIDRNAFEVGLPLIKKAGVEHKVEYIESAALPVLDELLEDPKNEGSFDYAFVDADKDNYLNYHEKLLRLVRVGGIIVYDNTLWSGTVAWDNVTTLSEYMKANRDVLIKLNKFLASDPRVQISQLSIGIDIDRNAFEVGLPLIKKAGVEHKVEFIDSAALPVLDELLEDPKNEGSFNYAFVDADKDNYLNYHEKLLKLVRVGGIIVYDNTLWSGTVAWDNVTTLCEYMKANRDVLIK